MQSEMFTVAVAKWVSQTRHETSNMSRRLLLSELLIINNAEYKNAIELRKKMFRIKPSWINKFAMRWRQEIIRLLRLL